jgi:hypothetical protein
MTRIISLIGLAALMLQPIIAQNNTGNLTGPQNAYTTIANIGQIVKLDSTQQGLFKNACATYTISCDSISADQQKTRHAKEKWQRKVNKHWQATLMNTLNDSQRVSYLTTITKSKVDSLVAIDMNILQSSGLFSADELQTMQNTLVNYHRQEQFILERDKYDINSRRENIAWLKKRSSPTYKLCEHILKMQKAGVLKSGDATLQTNNQ